MSCGSDYSISGLPSLYWEQLSCCSASSPALFDQEHLSTAELTTDTDRWPPEQLTTPVSPDLTCHWSQCHFMVYELSSQVPWGWSCHHWWLALELGLGLCLGALLLFMLGVLLWSNSSSMPFWTSLRSQGTLVPFASSLPCESTISTSPISTALYVPFAIPSRQSEFDWGRTNTYCINKMFVKILKGFKGYIFTIRS